MRALAQDDEQVAFWRRHARLGVALCVVLPSIVALRTLMLPAPPSRGAVLALAATVALTSPLLLLVPVDRVVRHPHGRLFFDAWEAVGVALVAVFAVLDGGVDSPYALIFYVLLAHAALAYPPAGMLLAGAGNLLAYLAVGAVAGGAGRTDLVTGSLLLMVATGTCAFASYNHVRAYRRTAAYAREIAVLAERDGLTGCLNHRTFHERLRADATVVGVDAPLSLLLVDVDDFKRVNDTHGHPVGDGVLRAIGEGLLGLARAGDAAGRLGGDEFALLLPGTGLAAAAEVAERVRAHVQASGDCRGVTVSVGVAATAARGDAPGLLSRADLAVYRAKRAGRNRVAAGDLPAQRPATV